MARKHGPANREQVRRSPDAGCLSAITSVGDQAAGYGWNSQTELDHSLQSETLPAMTTCAPDALVTDIPAAAAILFDHEDARVKTRSAGDHLSNLFPPVVELALSPKARRVRGDYLSREMAQAFIWQLAAHHQLRGQLAELALLASRRHLVWLSKIRRSFASVLPSRWPGN